jgi:EF-P beta-lysylation protein EpmB
MPDGNLTRYGSAKPASIAGSKPAASWKRELADAFTDHGALLDALGINRQQLSPPPLSQSEFPLLVPRPYAALMRHGDPDDPLLRQVLPVASEAESVPGFATDPVGDAAARRASGFLQKYHGRALLITTGACAVHCRYCFRRHFPYRDDSAQRDRFAGALRALAAAPDIDEVILSGGDPLMLDDAALATLIAALAQQPQLKRLRLHTRLPIVLPSRITEALCALLADCALQLVIVVHANHAAELGDAAVQALRRLARVGGTLLNQSVLLRGVNDDAAALAALSEALFAERVLPYYLHLLDPVSGAAHFDVAEGEGRCLVTALRERLPGYLVPRLVREHPGAAAKTILL